MEHPRVIGVDPGSAKPSAFAWQYLSGGGWRTQLHSSASGIYGEMKTAASLGIEVAIIEGCFLGKNSHSYMVLAIEQGRLRMAAELAGLRVVIADPRKWMKQSLVVSGHAAKTHKQLVAVAKLRAQAITGYALKEDEAMAVCLADWGACYLRSEG